MPVGNRHARRLPIAAQDAILPHMNRTFLSGLGTSPDEAAKKVASAKARELCTGFRERFHSIDCWELTSVYENEQDRKRGCTALVRTAVELVCELMAERRD